MTLRPNNKGVVLLATNEQDYTITVAIDGVRYEYWISGDFNTVLRQARMGLRHGAGGTIINLLKRRAYRVDRI